MSIRIGRSVSLLCAISSAILALGCAVVLSLLPSATTGVRLTASALIMDGTTFPTPSPGFMQSAIDDFIVPALGGGYTPFAVTTPEQAVGIDHSVAQGLVDLEQAMAAQPPGQPFVIFGFSQSTVITMLEKARLQQRLAAGEDVPPVTFVGIGVGNRPNGGIAKRLDGLVIPFFDFSFNGASPDNPAFPIPTIDIARQYDGLADTPQFILNPVADLNAILGVVFVHTLYGEEVSLDPNSPKYVPGTVRQQDGDTTYYWIPTPDLPLFDPLRLIGVPEKIIDIFEPFFRVLVEAGYDRTVPFGEPTPAQLIPVVDPITLANDLVGAVIEGLNNAAKIVGAQLPGYAALRERLGTVRSTSATVIGAPYRDVVSSINETVNPILAFNQIEGPVVSAFNDVVNGVGVPALLNGFIDPVLPPITAWAERNVLFPQPDVRSIPPAARVARQLLAPVAPALATDPSPANGTESAAAFEDPATSAAIPADPSATNARQHHQATTFTPHAHAETNSSTTGLGSVGTPAHSAASRHTSITPTGTPRPASTASTAAGGAGAKANAGSSGAAGAA